MVGDLLAFIDTLARIIGWVVIVGALFWAISRHFADRAAYEHSVRDREAEYAFAQYLKQEDPERYSRYVDHKRIYALEDPELHWHQVAQRVGVPTAEIIKDRQS
ncbi:hypothetical protein [Paraurantiacibacter namhicola]|uniref:hypothetical protein n=1 Tax=Paraurantiacibacter namhicola TaxID=645517 RepID=UPI0012ECF6A5|nr:hypothetical protein [Paraurantiacibacter namhicola]